MLERLDLCKQRALEIYIRVHVGIRPNINLYIDEKSFRKEKKQLLGSYEMTASQNSHRA